MSTPRKISDNADLEQVEVNSSDSVPTSEEYEIVPPGGRSEAGPPAAKATSDEDKSDQPKGEESGLLVDGGDAKNLEESLKECIEDDNGSSGQKDSVKMEEENINNVLKNENLIEDCDHNIFHNVLYLGMAHIRDPKNDPLIQRTIATLNKDLAHPLSVSVSIPKSCTDSVILREAATRTRVLGVKIQRIIFFARGQLSSPEASCFAFTSSAETNQGSVVQCHVFRCEVPEAVEKIFFSFARAFRKQEQTVQIQSNNIEEEEVVFEVGLEIKEDDGKGNFVHVPRDKDYFKLKSNVEKRVIITLVQVSDTIRLKVERCFVMLVSPGRNVRHSDMQLLEGVNMTAAPNGAGWTIQGSWDPRETAFAVLNQETGPDIQSVYMTVAADLVIAQIAEPVRFVVETKAKIFAPSEKFWYYSRKSAIRRYYLVVRYRPQAEMGGGGEEDKEARAIHLVEVRQGEEVADQHRYQGVGGLSAFLASWRGGPSSSGSGSVDLQEPTSPLDQEEESDSDEPVLSGSGEVSKDCSESELDRWKEVLQTWTGAQAQARPKQLTALVQGGVPEALRGEVWQRLSGASETMESTIGNYKILVTKETPDEKVIFRDIHRTFPAHEFFKEAGGCGQEALFRISKAYSVYDSEIGYCQGQSFLIAALLLQMPEEQAFGVLVQIMHKYGLRDMFRENFEELQLRFYQLERLLETNIPDLHAHFQEIGLETHMYASQWFLTLFSAKFPLFLVFRVLDVFLLNGIDVIFQVSLALLKMAKKELLSQEFEGTMKYFRVNLPKRLRSEDHAKAFMKTVCSAKIKRLAKYEKEWRNIKEAERLAEDPLTRFEKENKKLLADNLRLERENDVLARQLLISKTSMRLDLDKLEDIKDSLEKDLGTTTQLLEETRGEKQLLKEEAEQLKLLLKREVEKLEAELHSKDNIIAEYKAITKSMTERLDRMEKGLPPTDGESMAGGATEASGAAPHPEKEVKTPLESALARIDELELELAQTKLALVETECKNQDLAHQFSQATSQASQSSGGLTGGANAWLSKKLSSIKEATTNMHHADQGASHQPVRKSSSEHANLSSSHRRNSSKS